MKYEPFHYSSLKELKAKFDEYSLPFYAQENTDILFEKVKTGSWELKNRFVIQPMEGCDGTAAGEPGELTKRRYHRFAESGAALIWMEAVSVAAEGRANPRQLYICGKTADSFKRLTESVKEICMKQNGFEPMVILQATHSGRQSKPGGSPAPVIAYHNPVFEKEHLLNHDCIISDDALKKLEERFGYAAHLAQMAGFDGVDIKCCHGYLANELLSAFSRPGAYGGSFENRTRFIRNCIANANAAVTGNFMVTSRLGVYDGFPYPYGFGVKEGEGTKVCADEAVQLVGILHNQLGVNIINITAGNPYINPHVNRPYDSGGYIPDEHPFVGVSRIIACAGQIQKAYPKMAVVSSGYSYLRHLAPFAAAGAIENGLCTMAGFGRTAFAYPQFIADLKKNRKMDPKKCCITCSKCTQLMRMGTVSGCVVRDREVYLKLYQEACSVEK